MGAQQGSLPSALHAREFYKAVRARLFLPYTPLGENSVRCTPSGCLLIY